jgi:hypothetical protein
MTDEGRKEELLFKYSKREPRAFHQYDGFDIPVGHGDSIMQPDILGHCIFCIDTFELMNGADVRVLIRPEVAKETALILLLKIAAWLNNDCRQGSIDLDALHALIDDVKIREVEHALDGVRVRSLNP